MTRVRSLPCEAFIAYLLGELSDEDARTFWAHARTCTQCREDLERLAPVERELSGAVSAAVVPLPDGLKARTLARAFAARSPGRIPPGVTDGSVLPPDVETPLPARSHAGRRVQEDRQTGGNSRGHGKVSRRPAGRRTRGGLRAWLASSAVACAVVLGYLAGANFGLQPILGLPQNPQAAVDAMPLRPAPAVPQARGMAMLVKKGPASELIVMVHDLPPLRPGMSYNVWFVSGRRHQLAGILLVNSSGAGALSAIVPTGMPITALGISLEPGMRDLQPKGPMVLHARWQGV